MKSLELEVRPYIPKDLVDLGVDEQEGQEVDMVNKVIVDNDYMRIGG
jgi:hypothetical protein